MNFEFDYELTSDLSRLATRGFFRSRINWRVPLVLILYSSLLAGFAFLGGPGYLTGAFAGAGIVVIVVWVLAYLRRRSHVERMLAGLNTRAANARITDDGLELSNALGTSRIPWRMIDRVEPGPEVWVFYVMSQPMWLPTWALVGDPGKFILEKVGKKS